MSSIIPGSVANDRVAVRSLTELSEEERLLQSTVRRFAAEVIAPQVRAMDEAQQFAPGLVTKLADLGLMGIEVPEELGGSGGQFFRGDPCR